MAEREDMRRVEARVLKALKAARGGPVTPTDLARRLGSKQQQGVERAIRSLINQGSVQVTLDWRIKLSGG